MGSTHTRLLFHVVFATHERERRLSAPVRERLFPYLGGFIRNEGGVPVQIGGMPDHFHLLFFFLLNGAMGAYWMRGCRERQAFITAGARGQSIQEAAQILKHNLTVIHFQTPVGKKLAVEGKQYANEFLVQLEKGL